MKRSLIFWIVFFVLTLFSCGGGGSSGGGGGVAPEENKPPVADAGSDQVVIAGASVTLDGSNSSDPDGDKITYHWELLGNPGFLSDPDAAKPTFTPTDPAVLEFKLTVSDGDGKDDYDTCVVDVLTREQVEDVVYAAYAGIGYMSANPSIEDDEALYDVMFDDPNSLMGGIFWDVFDYASANPGKYGFQFFRLINGLDATLDYDHEVSDQVLYHAEIYIKPYVDVDCYRFTGTLSIDFKADGYLHNDCTYSGVNGTDDLVADIIGYYDFSGPSEFWMFMLRSLRIEVLDSLTASYSFGEVTYDRWEISYDVYYGSDDPIDKRDELNLGIFPVDLDLNYQPRDFRDYTLGGSFSIDGNEYTFVGFHYEQLYDPIENLTSVLIDGALSIPGLNGSVTIDTPYDVIRSSDGIWTSGEMTLTDNIYAEFTYDDVYDVETANFSADLVSWDVDYWQDDLEPY